MGPSPGRIRWTRPLATSLIAILAGFCGFSCDSDRERVASHMSRAERLALTDDPGPAAAVLELRNALLVEPGSADLNFRIAEILREQGDVSEAILYYEEALFLDPGFTGAAAQLSRLLSHRDPIRAGQLIEKTLAQHPNHAAALAVKAQLEADSGALKEALETARRSIRFDPELADAQWVLSQILIAGIQDDQRNETPVADSRYEGALHALGQFDRLSADSDPWSTLPERARLYGLWEGHEDPAEEAWKAILAETIDPEVPEYIEKRAVWLALELAQQWNRDDLRRESLERLVELEPENLSHWDEFAALRERLDGDGERILLDLLDSKPDDPEVYLRYAGYIRAVEGRDVALRYLQEHSENEILRPELLGALIELHEEAGEREDASFVLEALKDEYPYHPNTLIAESKRAMTAGDVARAASLLRRVAEGGGHPEALTLLAFAESSRRDYTATLDVIARAIETDPRQRQRLLPLRAHAYSQSGQCKRAVADFAALYVAKELNDHQKRLFGRCLYQIGRSDRGRQVLLHAMTLRDASIDTLLELARLEERDPKNPEQIRFMLENALAMEPENAQIVARLAALEHLAGDENRARERLESAEERGVRDPELRLIHARLLAESGNHSAARSELEELFRKQPHLPGLLPQLLSSLFALGDREAALAALERGERFKLLGPRRYVLYANLLSETGDRPGALRAYERAYQLGSRSPAVLIEIALLLAETGEQLDRAERLARTASESSQQDPDALDALGIVLLQKARYSAAAESFKQSLRFSAKRGRGPRASTHYRLGLALEAAGQPDAARTHFARAHALDENLPANSGTTSIEVTPES